MNQPIKEKLPGNPRFLVAPLDWGLGHTTRCIPIIRELVEQGCIVTLAGNGKQAELLLQEFPDLAMLPLQGYDIKYAKSSFGLIKNIIFQTPKLLRSIRNEHLWLQQIVEEYGFDAVISDNRFGLYHKKIPSIFITHQLTIKSPFGKWTEKMLQRRNYKYINRFTECWVPDYESENNLAGDLSHPTLKPTTPLKYIGALTRIKDKAVVKKEKHLAVILSGPEPQRSILEEKLINEISHYNGTATFIRGLPGNDSIIPSTNMIQFYNHLPTEALNIAMQEAEFMICRSGYSSVMDIAALQKKSIMIPTPGQTEQEYLADMLMKKGFAVCYKQNDFSLEDALQTAIEFNYSFPVLQSDDLLKNRIINFLKSITKN